jgi:hypothetical protein
LILQDKITPGSGVKSSLLILHMRMTTATTTSLTRAMLLISGLNFCGVIAGDYCLPRGMIELGWQEVR